MRNEKENLDNLLQSLSQQTYSNFEIILIDDHSQDGSVERANEWKSSATTELNVLSLNENQKGKKAALSLGINEAQGEVIATTDADCVVPMNWLQNINESFQNENIKMLIGAVAYEGFQLSKGWKPFFLKLQSIEFSSVIGTGIATCSLGKPTMCNGANLSFRKKTFDEVNGYTGNEHIASGDDEFLMRKILAKYSKSISVLKQIENVVFTQPQTSLKDFIQQRLRWASKWKMNSSLTAKLFAVFIFIVQFSWLIFLITMIFDFHSLALSILFLKVTVDLLFLSTVCRSLKMRFHPMAFIALQFLYPVYVLYIGIFSQIKSYQWKERTF